MNGGASRLEIAAMRPIKIELAVDLAELFKF